METQQVSILVFHDQQWFVDRVGKHINREDNGCGCDTCARISKFGLTIKSTEHAVHLFNAQNDMQIKYYE